MVASSVVSTILILNYHHRNADTHEMSEWASHLTAHSEPFPFLIQFIILIEIAYCAMFAVQVRVVFLLWLPCILRMSRPIPEEEEEDKQKKAAKIQCVELKDRSSKSLLANVLDIDDDIRCNHNCNAFNQQSIYRSMYRHVKLK